MGSLPWPARVYLLPLTRGKSQFFFPEQYNKLLIRAKIDYSFNLFALDGSHLKFVAYVTSRFNAAPN